MTLPTFCADKNTLLGHMWEHAFTQPVTALALWHSKFISGFNLFKQQATLVTTGDTVLESSSTFPTQRHEYTSPLKEHFKVLNHLKATDGLEKSGSQSL